MTQIVKCKVTNILGVKDVEFSPNGASTTIGGKNGHGKSSAISALIMALGGKRQIPEKPVHNGAERGDVVIELDRFTVKLRVNPDRESDVVIEAKDGARYASPQKILDDLFSGLSFDPGAFMSQDAKTQVRTLLDVVKLDLSENEALQAKAYEERTALNRNLKGIEARVAAAPKHEGVPNEELNLAAMMDSLNALQEFNRALAESERTAKRFDEEAAGIAHSAKTTEQRIAALRLEIDSLNAQLESGDATRAQLTRQAQEIRQDIKVKLGDRNTGKEAEELDAQIRNCDAVNRKVRDNQTRIALEGERKTIAGQVELLTTSINGLAKDREDALASAPFPVPGLSFADGCVTYNGVPFSQISESQQWEISTAISFALNPAGVVFMRKSGGLDRDSRERIRKRAAACGVQLFLEVVDDADDVQVVIEEGRVKANRLQAEEARAA